MARITFSPLVVEASGKVKDTVFSRWKGRAYIRARVTPSNPQSAAQTLVRNSMSRTVELYQSLVAMIKTAWDVYASPYRLSGYNSFTSANRADEQATQAEALTPANSDIDPITDLAAATGAATQIDLTWTDPGMGAGYYVYVATRKTGTNEIVQFQEGTTLASAGALTITGLVASTSYDVFIAVQLAADDTMSASDFDTATSG